MKSSEEVLALINHVRHKKIDGQLFLMSERLAWSIEKSQTFEFSYKYSEIKTQKISPEGKVKIQLQIVLYNEETFNFHFNNPNGIELQIKDRKHVKDLLQQLLPKFRKQVDAKLEEKNKLLQKNPHLFTLYKELVVTQIITPEEFWENYAQNFKNSNQKSTAPGNPYNIDKDDTQSIGVSGSYLFDLTPQSDGANGIKYNLTPDIIDSIFKIYPSVKKKHEENVPHNISEIEFWTKFFQSHYFHREKNLSHQSSHNKDYFFSECVKIDENTLKEQINMGEPNSLIDLQAMDDETNYHEPIFDVYSEVNNQNLTLIQRFNQHSILLNQATIPKKRYTISKSTELDVKLDGKQNTILETETSYKMEEIEKRSTEDMTVLHEKIQQEYQDLLPDPTPQSGENMSNSFNQNGNSVEPFHLTRPQEFLSGPTMDSFKSGSGDSSAPQSSNFQSNVSHVDARLLEEYQARINESLRTLNTDSALDESLITKYSTLVMNDFSPGGYFMKNVQYEESDTTTVVPQNILEDVKRAYVALHELLRHFYACFPVTSPALESKLEKVKNSLTNFYTIRIKAIDDSLAQSPHPTLKVTDHMIYMIRSALEKYSAWLQRAKKFASK